MVMMLLVLYHVLDLTGATGKLYLLIRPLLTNGYKDFAGCEVDWVFGPENCE
jgi:hypothetical protein